MDDNFPLLLSCKTLKPEFKIFHEIPLNANEVSIGRGLNNSIVLPLLSISRNHCTIKKVNESWILLDNSAFGITVNGIPLGKGATKELRYEDVVVLEPTEEFVYKFTNPSEDFKIPSKRIKLEHVDDKNILHNVKLKFEESQSYEIKHIEEKIQNAKNMQESSKIMKDKLQSELNIKIELVENDFASQIENLRGAKNEIAEQKTILIAERDMQLASLKKEMEEKIADLMNQIQKHHETESELLKENSNLKEKLLKDRTEFLDELNKESSSKQDMLEKLEAKLREQKEACLKEKEEMEQKLKNETEQLRLAKEKELKQLEELKKQRETELQQELNDIRKDLEQQVQKAAQEKIQAEQILSEERKKLTDEEKAKIEQLLKEKNEIQRKLKDAQENSDKAMEQLKNHVATRETELAALAADRIQKQTEQSSHVIISLQEQLESVKNQLKSVETEKNALLENMVTVDIAKEGSSKETALAEVGELMENELQCSICAELFVGATTLNCSHTFCKYCITMWKKKKKDCPICRSVISSECKSLVLDSFIEKMVLNLTEDMKRKREELLKSREEEVTAMMNPTRTRTPNSSRRGRRRNYTRTTTITTPTGRSAGATTTIRPIQTVDLTRLPMIPMNLPERPPVIPLPSTIAPRPQRAPTQLFRIVQTGDQTLMVLVGEEGGSQGSRARTTAVTGAATAAALADTGPPAAPTGSTR